MAAAESGLPAWDLGDLFRAADDPALSRSLTAAAERAADFQRRHRGRVAHAASNPGHFLAMLEEYEDIAAAAAKPYVFAALSFAESCRDPKRGALMQRVKTEHTAIFQQLLFMELEIVALPSSARRRLTRDRRLRRFRNYLAQLGRSRPHRLSEAEEKIFNDKNITGWGAFVRLFNEEAAHKEFEARIAGRRRKLTQTQILALLSDRSRPRRKAAAQALSAGLQEESRRSCYIFNTLVQDKSINDRYRKFPDPEAARHLENQIDQATVDALSESVGSGYGLVQRYYRLKRRALGLEKLYDFDRYAPLLDSGRRYSFTRARELVLESFRRFSPACAGMIEEFFTRRWIDAAERPGKRGGAFCSFGTPDLHPYVFLNFQGRIRDVFTLAHELGHALHACLMREQGYVNFDVPLTTAETASVFAEMLLFDFLRENVKNDRERFALYAVKVEEIFSTVFRQISMYRFEKDLHFRRRRDGELAPEAINALWRRRQRELYGRSVELTPGYDWWWSYIPHFVHSPFYVYAYAFGELLTLGLYARYQRDGAAFVPKYLEILEAGNTKSPDELLKPLKINLKGRAFWKSGVGLIGEMVAETERLYREI